MDQAELVVEVGCEEIPAWMLADAATQLARSLVQGLKAERLDCETRAIWYTPRRLIVGLAGLPVRQDDVRETVIGPPRRVAFDENGTATQAARAFAARSGIPLSRARIVPTPKGEYLALDRTLRGNHTRRILQRVIPAAVAGIQFPKTMYWTPDRFRFARPIRWVLAVFGGQAVRFRIADVASSRFTSGHRFLGNKRIAVASLESLREQLEAGGVIARPEERESRIREALREEAAAAGGSPKEDPELLETVVNLNECPSVICGSFETRFLALPMEILVTVMREHQKYFAVLDSRGELMPRFLAVINLPSDPEGMIRAGHERVLRARLSDAEFFWNTDLKTPLAARKEALKKVLYQEKLGSYWDKTRRILSLIARIAPAAGCGDHVQDLETAGGIMKCDLLTEMVKEFTGLQGIVGGLYARAEGYPETIWRAVYEQYLPLSARAKSPSTVLGAVLSVADRLDTVCGCFSVGLVPTGSRDPFALRRQGNGLLKIILDHRLRLSLTRLQEWGMDAIGRDESEIRHEVGTFLEGRLRFLLEEMGYSQDCIQAVFASGCDDPVDAMERVQALQSMRAQEDFQALAAAFKRIRNILAKRDSAAGEPDPGRMTDPAEVELFHKTAELQSQIEDARSRGDYPAALRALASMRPAVDRFFEEVLVMAEDATVRENRLALLGRLATTFLGIADLSLIAMEHRV